MVSTRIRGPRSAWLLVALAGCRAYEPRPLDAAALVDAADRGRSAADSGATSEVTFADAAAWLRERGPEVVEAVAAYRTALARARVPTPLPNPGIEIGPEFGFGDDVLEREVMPFGSLSIAIPLGGRLAAADLLNQASAEVARVEAAARHREAYLELRRRWARLVAAHDVLATRADLERAAEAGVRSVRVLIEAGRATALDAALVELELARARAEGLTARAAAVEAEEAVAAAAGVAAARFGRPRASDRPALPPSAPDLGSLKRELAGSHPALGRLRARYGQAECALRLEIERQVPDLRLGPATAGETGERKTTLGLALGIDVPLFDRNEQGIAEAEARREEVRADFEAAAARTLGRLEAAHRAYAFAAERQVLLSGTMLPQARRNLDLARESASAGAGDVLKLLESERAYRQIAIETIESDRAALEAWADLEAAVGRPLLRFPSEAEGTLAPPPEEVLDPGTGAGTGPGSEDAP